MEIDVKNIKAAYTTATESGKALLCSLFPNLRLDFVTNRIKTFADACNELGREHPMVIAYFNNAKNAPDITAYLKLRIITAALNEGWQPQFSQNERRWYPWFFLKTDEEVSKTGDDWKRKNSLLSLDNYRGAYCGFVCAYSSDAPSNANALIGSRLCYRSEALADFSGHQFIDLWADYYLIRK
jgi:hypothetical protein